MTSVPETAAPVDAATSPARRRWLYAGMGLVAAGVGGAVGWKEWQPHAVADGAEAEFWQSSFETLDGASLPMAGFKGKPLLLNFWATWCPPCVEELPLLNRYHAQHAGKGWQMLALAIDQPTAVRKFLGKLPLHFPVALAGLTGSDLGRALGNEKGGLPFTVVFGADGRILQRKMGQLTEQDLQKWMV